MIKSNLSILVLFIAFIPLFSCKGQDHSKDIEPKQPNEIPVTNPVVLDNKATVIYHDSKNNLWLASRDIGVYKYSDKGLEIFTSEDGILSFRVLSVQEDGFGNLYFDTPEGVFKYDGKGFSTLPVSENQIDANNWTSSTGDLWFRMGWDSPGPYRYDGKNLVQLQFPKNPMEDEFNTLYPNVSFNPYGIYSIYKDKQNNLWFGTSSLGLYLFNGKEISWRYEPHWTETPEGGAFGIRSVVEDDEGNYWICNVTNKYQLLPNEANENGLKSIQFERQTGLVNAGDENLYFLSMVPDHSGNLLMSNYENGIWINDGKTLEKLVFRDGEKTIEPATVYQGRAGIMWYGTENDGIYKYDGVTYQRFVPKKK